MPAKTYDYIVTVKPSKDLKGFDLISQLLLLVSVAALAYVGYATIVKQTQIACIIFAVLIVAKWIHSRVTGGGYRIGLIIAGIGWYIAFQNFLITLLYIICGLLEKQVKFKQEIGVDDEGVTFNSFPKKHYNWSEVANVIIKDGIITVDFLNNKIFQKEIESDTTSEMETEFNNFCISRLFSFAGKE